MERKVNDFMELTGTTRETARTTLRNNRNDLNRAVEAYLGTKIDTKLVKLFEKYKETPNEIGIDGTLQYLSDLQIEPEDVRALVLCYILDCEKMGTFTKANFLQGWTRRRVKTLDEMKSCIDRETRQMSTIEEFGEIYQYTFGFLLESPTQKLIAFDLLVDYWKLLFGLLRLNDEVLKRLDQWYSFLELTNKPINKDTYSMFWEFVREVIIPDAATFEDYDDMAAWPVLIDEYVEYLQDNQLLVQK